MRMRLTPGYRKMLRPVGWILALLLALQILACSSALTLKAYGDFNYIALHTVFELLAVLVSLLVFAVGWNDYDQDNPGALTLLAVAFLGVAILDFEHLLSYPGMPETITAASVDKTINFWLGARLLAAIGLLGMALLPQQRLRVPQLRWALLVTVLTMVAAFSWATLTQASWLPTTFISGQGLTEFKIRFEYGLSALYMIAAAWFRWRMKAAQRYDAVGLFAAAAVMAMSEVFFTLYANVNDLLSMLGHVYKIIAYGFLYQSVFVHGVALPYKRLFESKATLQASEERWSFALEGAGYGVWDWDVVGNEVSYSRCWKEMLGYADHEVGRGLHEWQLRVHPQDAERVKAELADYMHGRSADYMSEHRLQCKDGSWKWILTRGSAVKRNALGEPLRMVGTQADITARKLVEEQLTRMAHYDTVTGLPNRVLFHDRLLQEIKKSDRNGLPFALMFLDLDRFKEINDTLGHDKGDRLLAEAGRRLLECARDSDTVARLGGDEFTVILSGIGDASNVELVYQRILKSLVRPFQLGDEVAYVSASIGITLYPADADNIETLLKNADQAMYEAKKQGRNRYSYFTPAMQDAVRLRVRLANDLRRALADEQFSMVYQPIVELASGDICKAEALIRWRQPVHGIIDPLEFIPVAEDTGMIVEIGDWVFQQAAQQVKAWRSNGYPQFQISINKSPVQFHNLNHSLASWLDYLRSIDLPGSGIAIEITENLLLDASALVTQQLLDLREAGLQVSLDDFGTGYSSLSYLKKFNTDYVKIDRVFISHLAPGSSDMVLCEAIIVMAHKLGIKVIAEGVETPEQASLLKSAGCDYAQGYLYSKPVTSEQFGRLLLCMQRDTVLQ